MKRTFVGPIIAKVISGGQTGVDRAALEAAQYCNIETGGWAPKGWRTDVGADPTLADFGLREHTSPLYPPRTASNVRDSDVTIIVCPKGHHSPGTNLTRKLIKQYHRATWEISPYHPQAFNSLLGYLIKNAEYVVKNRPGHSLFREVPTGLIVNFAGPREASVPGITAETTDLLQRVFRSVQTIDLFGE